MLMNDMPLIVRQMRIYAERHMAQWDLGFPEQRILMFLASNAPSNQDNMAQSFSIDKGAIAKSMSKLEAKGYVTREVNPENKREKLINLTPAGREILEEMRKIFSDWEKAIYQDMGADERKALSRAVAKMAQNAANATEEVE